jgi:hypothetical protein
MEPTLKKVIEAGYDVISFMDDWTIGIDAN